MQMLAQFLKVNQTHLKQFKYFISQSRRNRRQTDTGKANGTDPGRLQIQTKKGQKNRPRVFSQDNVGMMTVLEGQNTGVIITHGTRSNG